MRATDKCPSCGTVVAYGQIPWDDKHCTHTCAINAKDKRIEELETQLDKAIEQLQEARDYSCCIFCKAKLPKDGKIIFEHMLVCEKHPISMMVKELDDVRKEYELLKKERWIT